MSRPTPGPWRAEGRYVKAGTDYTVCEVPCGGVLHGKIHDANAALIAASPDMLTLLKQLRAWDVMGKTSDGPYWCEAIDRVLLAVRRTPPPPEE